jgi:citrate synthase
VKLLEDKLEAQFAAQREEIRHLKREYGSHVISDITVGQLYGGLRGVTSVVCDTSEVDPQRGLIIRGRPVKELAGLAAEQVFLLLLTGDFPTNDETGMLHHELQRRRVKQLPRLNAFAAQDDSVFHPVVRSCMALQFLQSDSKFVSRYSNTARSELWKVALADALDILSVLPEVLALLHGAELPVEDVEEWAVRFGNSIFGRPKFRPYMIPKDESQVALEKLMRLYVLVHCDHEGSNACALACRTAASAHADPYLALTAGWRALAGPIHGLASQVCIEFIDEIRAKLGDSPDDTRLAAYVQQRIDSGRVIPGFGHAVLRAMDPRYELLHDFGMRHFPDDPAMRIADGLLRVVPQLLLATGKVSNPWPNVDGISGAIMQHYGLTDYRWLTVLFAACMSLGLLAQMVVSRGLGEPILHPKAITPELLRNRLAGS